MILRRITHRMSGENWSAISIEFVLVVLGVFLGIAAANWNEERLEKRETEQLLEQVDVALTNLIEYLNSLDGYYASAGRYGDRAIAGWSGDASVSDEEFLIAAYQASQINGVGGNAGVWGVIFGAENLRDIDDPVTRQNLARVMVFDYELVDLRAVSTRYREEVRKTIPHNIQSAIRARCGDQFVGRKVVLPPRCAIEILPAKAAQVAAALRAKPELVAELHWHRASVDNLLANVAQLKHFSSDLTTRIGSRLPSNDQR